MLTRLLVLAWIGLLSPWLIAQSPRIDLSDGKLKPSLLRVLANPQSFDGQEIQIIGFLCLTFENDALYLHAEDLAFNIFANAIWVDANDEMVKIKKSLNMKYVIIRGKFRAADHGHMGLYSGALTEITRCNPITDLKHPLWGGGPPPPPPSRKRSK